MAITTKGYFQALKNDSNTYKCSLEMPGVKKEDVSIEVTEYDATSAVQNLPVTLKVNAKRGGREYQHKVGTDNYIDISTIEAKLEDGILTITAKAREPKKTNTIKIQVQ